MKTWWKNHLNTSIKQHVANFPPIAHNSLLATCTDWHLTPIHCLTKSKQKQKKENESSREQAKTFTAGTFSSTGH